MTPACAAAAIARRVRHVVAIVTPLLVPHALARAQDSIVARGGGGGVTIAPPPPPRPAADTTVRPTGRLPFGVGEHAEYNVKFGIVRVGSGTMDITPTDSLRGHAVWHAQFHIQGGTFFYHVNDQLDSWFDVHTLSSLRFLQHLEEGGSHRQRDYEIYPERQAYVENQKPEQPSVSAPLDDAAFLYFIRTIPLVVGETLTFDRYFNPKSNPVTIRVLRRETVSVPAGKFAAIVIQPVIKTSGIFSKNGEAQVWLSDDSARVVLQLKSKLSFGSLDLYLRSFRAAPDAPPLVYAMQAGRARPDSSNAVDSTARAGP